METADVQVLQGPWVPDLHPVGPGYGQRYQELLAQTMGGPNASTLFAPLVSTADLHYRFLIATGRGLDLDSDAPSQWTTIAVDGALLSVSHLVEESFGRGDQMAMLYGFLGFAANPGLELNFRAGRLLDGRAPGGALRRRVARLALEQDDDEPAPCDWCRPPSSSFGAGLNWNLKDPSAPAKAPLLSYDAWMALSWRKPSGIQAQVSLGSWAWSASVRQRLWDGVSLVASVKSPDPVGPLAPAPTPVPDQASLGVSYHLPGDGLWNLRLDRRMGLQDQSWTWMLSLHADSRSPIPARVGPHLGGVDPEQGLQLPELTHREPLIISSSGEPR